MEKIIKKYKKETKYLNDKIASRPTKESLIARGILVENRDSVSLQRQQFSFSALLSPKPNNAKSQGEIFLFYY